MKRSLLAITALTACLAAGSAAHAATVDVSVNLTRSGAPSEAGFTNWATGDYSLPSNLVVDGLTLSVEAAGINAGSTLRSIDRGTTAYAGPLSSLTQTWWGQRASSSGPGGYITIDIAGLVAGTYTFTSWHLDENDQTGSMKIQISTDNGASFTDAVSSFDLVSGGEGATAPIEKTFDFVATGADVQVRFTNTAATSGSQAFALVNGFSIVPEPGSLALLGLGGVLVASRRRRD